MVGWLPTTGFLSSEPYPGSDDTFSVRRGAKRSFTCFRIQIKFAIVPSGWKCRQRLTAQPDGKLYSHIGFGLCHPRYCLGRQEIHVMARFI